MRQIWLFSSIWVRFLLAWFDTFFKKNSSLKFAIKAASSLLIIRIDCRLKRIVAYSAFISLNKRNQDHDWYLPRNWYPVSLSEMPRTSPSLTAAVSSCSCLAPIPLSHLRAPQPHPSLWFGTQLVREEQPRPTTPSMCVSASYLPESFPFAPFLSFSLFLSSDRTIPI